MRQKNFDLLLIATIALANIIWALLPSHPPVIGLLLALPLVFLLPGYVLSEAFFAKSPLNSLYRFIMVLGLSLSIDIVTGFILNIFPVGLQANSWAVFLGLLTIATSLLVAYLRQGTSTSQRQRPRFHLRIHEYILLGLSIVGVILSLEYSALSTIQQPHPDLTQFWLLPPPQTNNNCAVRLGVDNFETTSQAYRITIALNGIQVNTWPTLVLAPQGKWERLVPIPPTSPSSIYVEAWLYKSNQPETVYHEVHLTLKGSKGSTDQTMQC